MNYQSKRKFTKPPKLRALAVWLVTSMAITLYGGVPDGTSALAQNASGRAANTGKTAPTLLGFPEISQFIQDYFERKPHYKEGDLIVREEAQQVMQELEKKGVRIPDPDAILKKTLPKSSFLAKVLLGSRQGQKFMRQVSKYPLAYDQLDRLGSQPVGRRTVIDLAKGPDGYKMLEYMNTTRYGKNLGRMLSSDQAGGDYNKMTGKIYTAAQLRVAIWDQITAQKQGKGPSN